MTSATTATTITTGHASDAQARVSARVSLQRAQTANVVAPPWTSSAQSAQTGAWHDAQRPAARAEQIAQYSLSGCDGASGNAPKRT